MVHQWKLAVIGLFFLPVSLGCNGIQTDTHPEDASPPEGSGIEVEVVTPDQHPDLAGIVVDVLSCEGGALSSTTHAVGHQPTRLRVHLAAGCYHINLQALDRFNNPSKTCHLQSLRRVHVSDGAYASALLVGQCRGSLDAGLAINHPPIIERVEYSPSKFVYECEEVEICATAFDPNGDPLQFEFQQTGGQRLWLEPQITRVKSMPDGRVMACMRTSGVWNDDYEFQITAFDLGHDHNGPQRMEALTSQPSRAQLTVPLYTNWDVELHCYDRHTDAYHLFRGARTIDRIPGCIPIWPFQFYCSDYHWDDTARTCPNGNFLPQEVYPLCENYEPGDFDPTPLPRPGLPVPAPTSD